MKRFIKITFLFCFILFYSTKGYFQQTNGHTALTQNERITALRKMIRQPIANTDNYDVTYQHLQLTPSMSSRYLSGEVITYFTAQSDMSYIEFDFHSQMNVSSVEYHGNNLSFTHNNNQLNIVLPNIITTGTLDSIKITYSGNVPDTGLGSYSVATHNGKPVVWTLSEPYGARDWWPCKQDLTDKIDSIDIVLKYPKIVSGVEMTGVSNGLLTSESIISISGTDYKVSTWKHRYPIAAYLVAFAITNYTKFSQTAGIFQTFPIDNYVYPENLSLVQAQSGYFVPIMDFFEQKYGHYPFYNEKYGQIQFSWGGGMEHQTASFLANYDRYLVAHELAHQWFGDAVTCGSWQDIWLNEGFATYSEGLIVEEMDGQADFDNWKQNSVSYITQNTDGSVFVQDTTDIWQIFNYRLSYKKGAMILNMLRNEVGDSDFFNGLQNYVTQNSFQYVRTDDFKSVMENQSGKNLTEFFNDWIYGEGYPIYNIQVTRIGSQEYRIVINQTTSHSSVSFFELSLPFRFSDNNGNELNIKLQNTYNNQEFILQTGFEVTDIQFDPHYDIIHKNSQLNVNLKSNLNEKQLFKIYPNPANDYLNIIPSEDKQILQIEIYHIDGKKLTEIFRPGSTINITFLDTGTYWIKIKAENYEYWQRFFKK